MDESGIEATQALDFGDYEDDITDDEQSDNTPVGYLNVACQRGFSGKQYPVFEGDNVIGRGEDCKISIPLKPLSREHACIEIKGDSHFIYDKGSRNRTRRNNHFLAASVRYELKHNDKLIFGDVECDYTIGLQAANDDDDDGDETGSESMFQTAPGDDMLDNSVDTNEKTEAKLPDDEDYASDASSDILQPTQPSTGNTQSMLGNRTRNGNSMLAQNITVKETPAASKTKRFTEDLVLPESDSDTDNESPSKPPATMAIVADSQDDDDEDENVKSRMMGAATQAYVCESDVTTDDEDGVRNKSSILAAPTQAFLDDDVSTCSEDSPEKKLLMTAATQAFAADSDDNKTPKKSRKVAPTVAYDMDSGIEPTQGYDMDTDTDDTKTEKTPQKSRKVAPTVAYDMDAGIEATQGYDMNADTDDEKEENEEEQKSSGILFEPTQAYVGKQVSDDKEDVEDNKSDTSEEFVLEGDTDAEDSDTAEILAAPTLAVDGPGECETQVVSTEDQTQVVDDKGEEDATVAVVEEATQVFDEPKSVSPRGKRGKNTAKTKAIFEAETQVFQDNEETDSKQPVTNDDATQVFDEGVGSGKEQKKASEPYVAETQVFYEDSTQVFDEDQNDKTKHTSKCIKVNEQAAETQVFNDDATQCFDDRNNSDNKSENIAETQVFEEVNEVNKDNVKMDTTKQEDMATQEFVEEEDNDAAEGVSNEEGETFDIMAASTLAFNAETGDDIETEDDEKAEVVEGGEEATQVFDEGDQTVAVNDDQTLPVKSETVSDKPTRSCGKQKNAAETVAVTDDATQVIEEKPIETMASRGRRKQAVNDTVAVSDDATQVFDATVAVNTEDQTVPVEDISSKAKQSRRTKGKKSEPVSKHEVSEDATQVFDETVAVSTEDQTVSVEELEKKRNKSVGRRKGKNSEQAVKPEVNEDATQIVDDTLAVIETVSAEEVERKTKSGGRRKGKKSEQTQRQELNDDATQVFDETVPISGDDQSVHLTELETKPVSAKTLQGKDEENTFKQEITEDATQIFDETEHKEKPNFEKTDKKEIDNTLPVSEDMDVNSETDSAKCNKTEVEVEASGDKGKRTRGKCSVSKDVEDNLSKNKVNKKSKSKEMIKKTEEVTGNVRKSGRTRGKAALSENDQKSSGKQTTADGKDGPKEESRPTKKQRTGMKKEEKNVEPDLEEATQLYADNDEVDEAATQRYEDVEDDDQTPDLAEIEEEKNVNVQVVETESSRGRSPLKSALASPKKKKSPSPKKVQFVSQNSETGSESGEPSRRSKRGNKGLKIENEQDDIEKQKEKTTKASKTAPVVANKRSTRGKVSVKTDKVEKTEEVDNISVQNETEKSEPNTRGTRGNSVKTKQTLDSESDSQTTSELSSEIVNKVTVKSTRKGGRRSVDTEKTVDQRNENRKTRTSLPIVLEESKSETSQQTDKSKDNEAVDDKQNVIESKVKEGKKNVKGKGKGKNSKVVVSENSSLEDTDNQEPPLEVKGDTEPSEKRTSRSTRTNMTSNKSESVKETKSYTIDNNSVKNEENNTTRSQRNSRRKAAIDAEDNQVKKRKIDHDIAEGSKREESPVTSTRTRTSRNKADNNDSSETKHVVDKEDASHKSKGKSGKVSRTSVDKSEDKEIYSDESKSDIVKDEEVVTGDKQKVKGKVLKGKKGKEDKTDSKTVEKNVKTENVDNEVVEKENKGLTRSKRGKGMKALQKEEKEDPPVIPPVVPPVEVVGRSRRLKRKESASSSNDSQESETGETPAKRQKKKSDNSSSTPKPTEKKKTTVNTPKGTTVKELDTSVTHSPTLRRKTTEEMKPKVMFTGVVDEHGEKIVKELGGDLVSSVTECTHLVTDQVRRTVKFLCCLSRGIPIVSPQWLVSSKASGFFLDPSNFLVKDEASERKYKFNLENSIEKATKKPVFSSFTFKITKSVKPEPQHMKDILKCAGAIKFVEKMPDNAASPLTFVISCPEDQAECEPAYKVGIPVMTNEFVLTGILRQEMDIASFKLERKENGSKRQATISSQDASKKRRR